MQHPRVEFSLGQTTHSAKGFGQKMRRPGVKTARLAERLKYGECPSRNDYLKDGGFERKMSGVRRLDGDKNKFRQCVIRSFQFPPSL
jgi:hypothetical protein